ncbi:PH domain-like [Phytophthora cactorum]|nr:PH domain-like [Phytophthora cactorum]
MVLYEMLTGLPPWYTRNRQELFARIREAPLEIPNYLSRDAASLIQSLLHREPEKRLGSRGASDVKAHRFFRTVDWDGLLWAEPPFKPSDRSPRRRETHLTLTRSSRSCPLAAHPEQIGWRLWSAEEHVHRLYIRGADAVVRFQHVPIEGRASQEELSVRPRPVRLADGHCACCIGFYRGHRLAGEGAAGGQEEASEQTAPKLGKKAAGNNRRTCT